jgi:hypothetical protein
VSIEPGSEILDAADPADVAEQRAELDHGASDNETDDGDRDLPLEADPADVAEQGRAVPYDDER